MDRGGLWLASRGRERSWWLLAVAIGAAVLVAVIAKIEGAPAWIQLTCLAVGTGLGLFVVELRARRAQDDKAAVVVRENVADGSERLRRLRDVGAEDAGVHRATEDVAYVQREVEPEVERLLRGERRVLIVGPSMSGKTRLALQVTKRLYADYRLLVPRNGKAVHALLAAGVTGAGLVIWLDDLDRYLGSDGLRTDVLDRFHERGNVVVATIRSAAYKDLLPVGELRPAGWEVPGWFGDPVWLNRWTEGDLDRTAATVSAKVLAGARQHGLSAYLGGGPLARAWLHTGATTDPLGYALVRIAADWRRVGVSSPTPRPVLVALAPAYIATTARVDEEAVRQGLEWATARINDTVALLDAAAGGYSVLDYILDDLTAHHPPIPRQTWDAALEHADSGDLVSVGYRAAGEHGQLDVAETAFRRSAACGEVIAMANVGVLLHERGEDAEAEQWLRKAAELNFSGAMDRLGVLLTDRAEEAEAEQWFRKAAELNLPQAMNNLGRLLASGGEKAEAEQWFRKAAELSLPEAMFNLGNLLDNQRRMAEAEQWFRKAADHNHPAATFSVAELLASRGEKAEAEQWFRRAAELNDAVPMYYLGRLLRNRGEMAEAEQWFRRAAELNQPVAKLAMIDLGELLANRGERADAEQWYRKAIDLDPNNPRAMMHLGELLENRGEIAEAERWYRRSADLNQPIATFAMFRLGVLLTDRAEKAEAEQWYRKAAELNLRQAMCNLGVLLHERGEKAEAEQWFRKAAELNLPRAMCNLGVLLHERGEKAEAEQWFRKADSVNHPSS